MFEVHNLSCRRGGRLVFRTLSFGLGAGGFLLVNGANGSGKSSLLRALAGLAPCDGVMSWHGTNVTQDWMAQRERSLYIGHLDAVKTTLTVREHLDYWQALRGTAKPDQPSTLEAFALTRLADRAGRSLSAGQKRRLSLTRLVLHDAPLWLLDEPTTALDRDGQALLFDRIANHRAKGGMVIAASHDEMPIKDAQILTMPGGAR